MEDRFWAGLQGGYRVPFDPRSLLAKLRDDPENDRLWSELIEELYHQGDVGEASYAAVPEVVKIGGREELRVYASVLSGYSEEELQEMISE
jgi:hypothetical protein